MSRRESDQRDAELHALLRQAITRRGFIRRSALGAGGLVLGNSLLAACGGGKEGAPRAAATRRPRPRGGGGKTLRISNWPLYIDKQTVPDFEKATGIKTEYTEDINDNGEFFAKIDEPLKRNQSIDRDDHRADRLDGGPHDQARLRRPARRRQVPQQGEPGRQREGRELRSGPQVQRAMALGHDRRRLQPQEDRPRADQHQRHLRPEVQGPGHDADRDAGHHRPGHAGPGEGSDEGHEGRREAACAKIKKARESGQIRKFTGNDYAEDLAAGNIAVAFAWSGDIQGLAADNPDLRWIAPKEGAMLYSDNMMIPKTVGPAGPGHGVDQLRLRSEALGPDRGRRALPLGGQGRRARSWPRSRPTWPSSSLVNPPDDLRARLHVFRALSDAEDTEFNRIFQDAIGA